MIIKESVNDTELRTGDLIEVVTNDGRKFKSIVVTNLGEGFVNKVLSKDKTIGTASWRRYGLIKGDGRFQSMSECKSIKVLERATESSATSTLTLNESVSRNQMKYYETSLGDGKYATFCVCEGFGGWSFHNEKSRGNALQESFLNSQISRLRCHESN